MLKSRPYLGIYRILGQWGPNRVPSPRHYARNARKGPSESESGPAPKPMSRVCPSARSRPPRVSAPVGTPARSPVATVSSAGRTDPTNHAPEAAPSQGLPDLLTRWQSSSRCREWLERLDCGELVVVNLRPETDSETEYVSFDRPRVPTRSRPKSRTPRPGVPATGDGNPEPDPPAKAVERSGKQEERAALWAALGLPPHERRSRPTPVEIGIGPFPSRGGLGKGPLNETR